MDASDDSIVKPRESSNDPAPLACLMDVVPESRLRSELEQIAETISRDTAFTGLAKNDKTALRMDFATGERSGGTLRLRKFYLSVQSTEPGRFFARTFVFDRKTKVGAWLDFPVDPALPGAAGITIKRVLRYIPLRRLTFVGDSARGGNAVWKFKREERFSDAAQLLERIGTVVGRGEHGFNVPRLVEIDRERAAFSQTMVEGVHLRPKDLGGMNVSKLAQVMTAMQRIELEGIATLSNLDLANTANELMAWISMLMPDQGQPLSNVSRVLSASMPLEDPPGFCHGDFNLDQVLVDPIAGWTLLDFDRACYASACRDIAHMAVTWEHRSGSIFPLEEFLSARTMQGGEPLARPALSWHITCAKIHRLAQLIKKGRLDAAGVRQAIALIHHPYGKSG
jgi:thiamine kinase-like enzyme